MLTSTLNMLGGVTVDLADRTAILELLARYCHACDDGDFEELVTVFAPDGRFDYGGDVVAGRAALGDYFAQVQTPERRGKHLVTNAVVTVDGDRATVVSDWLFLAFVEGVLTPRLTGRYDDVLVRGGDGWVIAERVVTPLTAQ